MAGAGKKTFAVNEVLSAADVNNYLMDQSVMRFADSTARSSAIGTPSEGMVSYLDDSNQVEVFDGSSWVNFTGDINQVTAGTALTGGGTEGNVTLNVDETELFTGGTAGYTALSNGTAGLSYQPVSHNYIINGAFDIWQRGTSSGTGYLADRFVSNNFTQQEQSTDTPINSGFSIKFQRTNGTIAEMFQRIEAENIRQLAGKTVTISWYAKEEVANNRNTFLNLTYPSAENDFGTLIGIETSVGTQAVSTSWQRFSYTTTLPADVDKGLQIGFGFSSINEYFYLWGVQLEAGSIATPFKRNANSIQGELAACQRYYQRLYDSNAKVVGFGYAQTTTEIRITVPTSVEMRDTVNLEGGTGAIRSNGSTFFPSSVSVNDVGSSGVALVFDVTGASGAQTAIWQVDSDINLEAEL